MCNHTCIKLADKSSGLAKVIESDLMTFPAHARQCVIPAIRNWGWKLSHSSITCRLPPTFPVEMGKLPAMLFRDSKDTEEDTA